MHYTMPITQRLKKLIRSLHQKQFRDQNGLFLAEGEKLATELVKSNFVPELIVIKDSPGKDIFEVVEHFAAEGVPVYSAPKHQFDQLCDTKSPQNILVVINIKHNQPDPEQNFIALDGISDPGNVGTIIRTASWFGFKQVILGRDCADEYHPKTVRATMGAIFQTNILQYPNLPEFINLNFKKHKLFGATLNATKSINEIKTKAKFGVVFGSESHGISQEMLDIINDQFLIDGKGDTESLNVAVAAGISMYHFSKYN